LLKRILSVDLAFFVETWLPPENHVERAQLSRKKNSERNRRDVINWILKRSGGRRILSETPGAGRWGGVLVIGKSHAYPVDLKMPQEKAEIATGMQSQTICIPERSGRKTFMSGLYLGVQSTPQIDALEVMWTELKEKHELNPERDTWILAGDWNCTHQNWFGEFKNMTETAKKRKEMIDYSFLKLGVTVISDEQKTRRTTHTAPDAILAVAPMDCESSQNRIDLAIMSFENQEVLFSDHNWLQFDWVAEETDSPGIKKMKNNYSDPETGREYAKKFEILMQPRLVELFQNDASPAELLEELRTIMIKAAGETIPRGPVGEGSPPKNVFQRDEVSQRIEDNRKCRALLSELDDDLPRMYRMIRTLDGRMGPGGGHCVPIITPSGKTVIDMDKKADAFSKEYARPPTPPLNEKQLKRAILKRIREGVREEEDRASLLTDLFPLEQVLEAMRKLKGRKCAGPDSIDPELIKLLEGTSMPIILQEIFRRIRRTGDVPIQFRKSEIFPIYKGGKKCRRRVLSYRPINLVSTFQKVWESVLLSDMHPMLELGTDPCQHAYFRGRSTETCLAKIKMHIDRAHREGMKVMIVQMDLTRAFESASRLQILQHLERLGLKGKALREMMQYLQDRYHRTRLSSQQGQHIGRYYRVGTGVPQGSSLGPVLFNVSTDELPRSAVRQGVTAEVFADDLTLIITAPTLELLQQRAQAVFDDTVDWYLERGFAVNPDKSKFLLLGDQHHLLLQHRDKPPATQVMSLRVLGIIFDADSRWSSQVDAVIDKVRVRSRLLCCLKSTSWGCSAKTLETAVKTYVVPVITYGLGVYYPYLSPSEVKAIQTALNTALRVSVQAPTTTRLQILHREADVLPVRVMGRHQVQILRERIKRSRQHGIPQILEKRYGWAEVTRPWDLRLPYTQMLSAAEVAEVRFTDTELQSLTFASCTVENENEMQDLRTTEEFDLVLATDGSYEMRTGLGACAYIIHEEETARQERHRITYAALPSAYSAEQDAIFRGLQRVKQLAPRRLLVATDSLSSMERIQSTPEEQADYLLRKQLKELLGLGWKVKFAHVRAHAGICLNETADMIATGFLPASDSTILTKREELTQEEPQCAICFEEMGSESSVGLPCGHTFHKVCFEEWVRINPNPTCPLCRGPIEEVPETSPPPPQPLHPNGSILPMTVKGIRKMLKRQAWVEHDANIDRIFQSGESVGQVAHYYKVTNGLKLKKLRAPDWVHPVVERIGIQLRTGNCPLLGEYRGRFLDYVFPGCAICKRDADGRIDHFLQCPGVGICLQFFEDLSTSAGWSRLSDACHRLREHPDPTVSLLLKQLPPQPPSPIIVPPQILQELQQVLRQILSE